MPNELPLDDSSAVAAVAELAERGAQARVVLDGVPDASGSLLVRVLPPGDRIEVLDLERHLGAPREPRGSAAIHEPSDFIAYVTRHAGPATTIWATQDFRRFTAVFNDHDPHAGPGWRDHRATLQLQLDPDWAAWIAQDGKLVHQAEFAEFLEDNLAAITDPPAADMLEVATTFHAHRNVAFRQGVRLSSGDVQLHYQEETTGTAGAKGALDVPREFTVRLAPYLGVDAVYLTARLRWRITEGTLRIGYKLHRRDLVEAEAFDRIRSLVAQQVGDTPVLLGEAPTPLR